MPPPNQSPLNEYNLSKRKVGLEDFKLLAVLGKGNFGKVSISSFDTELQ